MVFEIDGVNGDEYKLLKNYDHGALNSYRLFHVFVFFIAILKW